MPTVKPLDLPTVERAARELGCVVTLEEHFVEGGFGSAVAEHVAELGLPVRFKRLGVANRFAHLCGDQTWHRQANGLAPEQIVEALMRLLARS
jgi:transketolase